MEDSNHLEADSVALVPNAQRVAAPEGAEKSARQDAAVDEAPSASQPEARFSPAERSAEPALDPAEPAGSDMLGDGLETDAPPVWENADSEADLAPDISDDPWSFLNADGAELPRAEVEPEARERGPRKRAVSGLERVVARYVLCVDLDDFLSGLLGRQNVREASATSAPELWQLLRRARARGESEPRLLGALMRAHLERDLAGALPLICGLLTRRLALPSVTARPREVTALLRLELVRGVCNVAQQALRSLGGGPGADAEATAVLQTLPRLAARVGVSAAARQLPLTELVPALRREIRRAKPVESAATQFNDLPQKRSGVRRFRLPGRVEIVIYAK